MRRAIHPARARHTRARVRDESGMALVMVIGIMLVLSITGARDAGRVNAGQNAYALAEAGDALSVLYNGTTPHSGTGNDATDAD